ncbi:MAG: tetratricopeptide repeat protein [Bacteroidales bacterium]
MFYSRFILIGLLIAAWSVSFTQDNNNLFYAESLNQEQLIDNLKDNLRKDSSNIASWLMLGNAWEKTFQFDSAATAYQRAVDIDSICIRCKQLLASTMSARGMVTKAINIYEDALTLDSSNTVLRSQYARLLKKENRFNEAFNQFRTLIKTDSTNYYIWEQIGDCAMKIDSGSTAILAYMHSFELNPANMPLAVKLINGYINSGVPSVWIKPYAERAYQNDSTYIPLIRSRGYLEFLDEDYKMAEHWFNKSYAKGDSSRFTKKFLGISLFHNGMYGSSADYLEKAFGLDSTDKVMNFVLASALQKIGDRQKSIDILNLTEKLITPCPEELGMLYASRGNAYSIGQQYAQAIEQYKRAIELNPQKLTYYYDIGQCYFNAKNYQRAQDRLNQYLDLYADRNPEAFAKSGRARYVQRLLKKIDEELFFAE